MFTGEGWGMGNAAGNPPRLLGMGREGLRKKMAAGLGRLF
jgi:hypothetical protein